MKIEELVIGVKAGVGCFLKVNGFKFSPHQDRVIAHALDVNLLILFDAQKELTGSGIAHLLVEPVLLEFIRRHVVRVCQQGGRVGAVNNEKDTKPAQVSTSVSNRIYASGFIYVPWIFS